MRILVTGGAGYLGSILVSQLLERDHEVTVYDVFLWGFNALLPIASHPRAHFIKGDVRDTAKLAAVVKGQDVVVNLAAIVGYPACAENPNEARTINLDAVGGLSKMMSKSQLLIQASTGSTYGQVDGICTEETPINPLTLYGETKARSEAYTFDVDGIALRFATVFGVSPRMRLDLLVNDIVYQVTHYKTFVMYEGGARRTFIHSSDAARSILFAIENGDKMRGRPYNIGDDGLNYTKRQIAEMIREDFPYYLHHADVGEDLDKRDYAVSYARVKQLGFSCQVDMRAGVRELLKVMPFVKERSPMRNI